MRKVHQFLQLHIGKRAPMTALGAVNKPVSYSPRIIVGHDDNNMLTSSENCNCNITHCSADSKRFS